VALLVKIRVCGLEHYEKMDENNISPHTHKSVFGELLSFFECEVYFSAGLKKL
jgi:hypothetical protein